MRRALVLAVAAMLVSGACRRAKHAPAHPAPTQQSTAAAPAGSVRTAAFWAWFQKNAAALRADENLQRTMETISEELEKAHPGVFSEIGGHGDERLLVISVDGKSELFPVVHEIYGARPNVPGWTIVAFRQRSDPDDPFTIEMNGKKVDPKRMKFTSARNGQKLDITVFVPGFTTLEELGQPALIVLDHVVGEYDMETKIGGIEWAAIQRAPSTARPLVELPALLDKTFPPKP